MPVEVRILSAALGGFGEEARGNRSGGMSFAAPPHVWIAFGALLLGVLLAVVLDFLVGAVVGGVGLVALLLSRARGEGGPGGGPGPVDASGAGNGGGAGTA
jgi:hypothetical protein